MEVPAVRRNWYAVCVALAWGVLFSFLMAVVLNEVVLAPRALIGWVLIAGIVIPGVRGWFVMVEARPEGLWVRNVFRNVLIRWDEVASVKRAVAGRGTLTLAVTRRGELNAFVARVNIVALGGVSLDRARAFVEGIATTYPADREVSRVVALMRAEVEPR